MNILILGSGGREHALAWKISQSKLCSKLFVAPGNAGTSQCATNISIGVNDFSDIEEFCKREKIGLLVIGPEDPLVNGLVDFLKEKKQLADLLIIGPSKEAAQLEGSKAFAKAFMNRQNIPTAAYREFTADNFLEGVDYLNNHSLPIVLKADGLAAGKGVVICESREQAVSEFTSMIREAKFGEASSKVVVEEFLSGIELSVFVLTDGTDYVLLPEAKDYKRIGEGDKGLNTGGMGAVSPVPFAGKEFMDKVRERIIEPTIQGLDKEKFDYKGFVFFGLIKVGEEPYVIEYNCRMGDPETEVVVPRIQSDLVEALVATAQGELENVTIEQEKRVATTIMAVSGGYPGDYKKGEVISGLGKKSEDVLIFHAGTKAVHGNIVTNGGRVICATALANTLGEAISRSKEALSHISFNEMYFRKDIGYEFTGNQ
jgi:phosphoribosylamine---glycine ligase